MAIFGFDGLKFLALDLAVLFALYGQKEVALTKENVKAVERVVVRKAMAGEDKEAKARITAAHRQQQVKGRTDLDKTFVTGYVKKAWLR